MEKYDLRDGVEIATTDPINEEILSNLFPGQPVYYSSPAFNIDINYYNYYFIQNVNGTVYCKDVRNPSKFTISYKDFIERYVSTIDWNLEELDRIIKEKENGKI